MNNSKKLITVWDVILIVLGIWWLLILAAPLKAESKEIDELECYIFDDEEREKFYKEAEEDLKIHIK